MIEIRSNINEKFNTIEECFLDFMFHNKNCLILIFYIDSNSIIAFSYFFIWDL